MKQKKERLGQVKATGDNHFCQLRLFVAGNEPNSIQAREVLFRLCDEYRQDRYEIKEVDVFDDYQAAIDHNVVMIPSLIAEAAPPVKIVVGSLSDEDKVRSAPGLPKKGERS